MLWGTCLSAAWSAYVLSTLCGAVLIQTTFPRVFLRYAFLLARFDAFTRQGYFLLYLVFFRLRQARRVQQVFVCRECVDVYRYTHVCSPDLIGLAAQF